MVQICIYLLEDIEAQLGLDNISADGLKKLGDLFNKRIHKISNALKVLEKNGWKWTTGTKDIKRSNKCAAQSAKGFTEYVSK